MKALIFTVWCIAYALGLTYEVVQVQKGGNLRCNSSAVIICKFSVNVSAISWKIAPDVKNSNITAAVCFSSSCSPHNSFSTKYSFTFDQQSGVSNVTIKKVTFEHSNLEFRCDDGTTPDPVKLNVTEPPTIETTVMTNTTDELKIETACVYPTENVYIKWFSKQINGSVRQEHTPSSSGHQLCNTSSECILANKSANITSALKLSTLTSMYASSQRSFEVEIIYGSGNYTFFIGNFLIPDTIAGGSGTDGSSDGTPRVIGIVIGSIAGVVIAVGVVLFVKNRVKHMTKTAVKMSTDDTPVKDSVTTTAVASGFKPESLSPNGQTSNLRGKGQMIDATGSSDVENPKENLMHGPSYQCDDLSKCNNISSLSSSTFNINPLASGVLCDVITTSS